VFYDEFAGEGGPNIVKHACPLFCILKGLTICWDHSGGQVIGFGLGWDGRNSGNCAESINSFAFLGTSGNILFLACQRDSEHGENIMDNV
jgi:hypothetical protein